MLAIQKDVLPNVEADATPAGLTGGRKLQKTGNEEYLLLPLAGQSNVTAGTYYVAVVSEGLNPTNSRSGSGSINATLSSLGSVTPVNLGVLGADLTASGSLAGGEIQTYQFTVPPGYFAVEVWLENRTGNPMMTLRTGGLVSYPYASTYGWNNGTASEWNGADLINISLPTNDVFTLTVQASQTNSSYPPATYNVRVRAVAATPLVFDNGTASVTGQDYRTWRFFEVTVPSGPLGWDMRINSHTNGDPRLVIRRALVPDSLSTHSSACSSCSWTPASGAQWSAGNQWAAGADWTGYANGPDGTNETGHILQMGMGDPLEPGVYYIGVASGSGTGALSYTLLSRGIGAGFTIPVGTLAFDGGSVTATNLPAREAAYFAITVPTNQASWKLRLGTNSGDGLLLLQKDCLPNVGASATFKPQSHYGGRKLQKPGHEHYLFMPDNGAASTNIPAGTYYAAIVSEGWNPGVAGSSRIGTNTSSFTLQSAGEPAPVNMGTLGAATDLVLTNTLEGGEARAYQFLVSTGVLSMEVRLENKAGKPRFSLRSGNRLPSLYDDYGNDGGQTYQYQNTDIITVANPTNDLWTVLVHAAYTGGSLLYSNAGYTLRLHAVGGIALPFDGGSQTITGQVRSSWQYFTIAVPSNAAGWDLRLTNITSGDPELVVRRDILPDSLSSHSSSGGGWYFQQSTTWPSGNQWAPDYDWSTNYFTSTGTNILGWVLQCGMGNPLQAGNYCVGVYGGGGNTNALGYTLVSRGIGAGFAIPVTPLAFNGGSATNAALPVREAAYFSVVVPTNTPSWKVRLAADSGDSFLLVQKGALPGLATIDSESTSLAMGRRLYKAGNDHYLLLPDPGQTNVAAGTYYLAVISEGQFPIPSQHRYGSNTSDSVIQSQGSLAVDNLGLLAGAELSRTNSLEGGEVRAYAFTLPADLAGVEFRLDNRSGNPLFNILRGSALAYPPISYGYDNGWSPVWSDDTVDTVAQPAATNYTAIVAAGVLSNVYANAAFTFRVRQVGIADLAFDAMMGGGSSLCGTLADNERAFYRVQVPAQLPDGTPVTGWELRFASNTTGTATLRVRKDLLPSDAAAGCGTGQSAFVADSMTVAPPYLTPGTWYVEVCGSGQTAYCLDSGAVRLQRPAWQMPARGQPITTPGLSAGPDFADSGVSTNGVWPGDDGGADLEQGFNHYYAFTVPSANGGLVRVVCEAISGNPDVYIRADGIPTLDHDQYGGTCSSLLVDRRLTGTTTEYGNFVPNQGCYETELGAGTWYVAVRASGGSNCRYRLHLSTGQITELPLTGGVTNRTLAAGDWCYFRFNLPTNAPVTWNFGFQQTVGDVVVYLRDTLPPGLFADRTDYRHWGSYHDSKNHGALPGLSYPSPWDAAGFYTNAVPPLRPGHVYYAGFRAVSDSTFTAWFSNAPVCIDATNVVPFYGGVTNGILPVGGILRFRVDVPVEGRRWNHYTTNDSSVWVHIDQGSLPTLTTSDHYYNRYGYKNYSRSLYSGIWPWMPGYMYYICITNTSASAQPFFFRMDGQNCDTDDSDSDQLPDCWEMTYFSDLFQTGAGDPDVDGFTNLQEWRNGTNPLISDRCELTNPTMPPAGPMQFQFTGRSNVPYRILSAPTVTGEWSQVLSFTNTGGTRLITDTNNTHTNRFYRAVTP